MTKDYWICSSCKETYRKNFNFVIIDGEKICEECQSKEAVEEDGEE